MPRKTMRSSAEEDGERATVMTSRSFYHGQARPLFLLNFFPPAADFTERIGREDVDFLLAQPRFAALDLGLEGAALFEQRLQNFFLRHIRDFFALHVDDAATVAGEDGDVGAFAFARAVHDTS